MTKDINSQKYIYFYSPNGTWTRINSNLYYLGLNKNKKICNTYARDFDWSVRDGSYNDKYSNYDVIYLDEFYDHEIDYDLCYKVLQEFVNAGKQIVMAGHGNLDSLVNMPDDMKKRITSYDLIYELDIDTNIEYLK